MISCWDLGREAQRFVEGQVLEGQVYITLCWDEGDGLFVGVHREA